MGISEIYEIETNNTLSIYLYKEGSFWKAYERSACLFVKNIKNYKTKKRYYKNIQKEIISIGFPDIALSGILEGQPVTKKEDLSITIQLEIQIIETDFEQWKKSENGEIIIKNKETVSQTKDRLVSIIQSFSLANSTPMDCLQFVARLQKEIEM